MYKNGDQTAYEVLEVLDISQKEKPLMGDPPGDRGLKSSKNF